MIPYLTLKAATLSKGSVIAALASGTFSMLAADWLTGNWPMALVLSAVSAPAAAYFASRPKVIAALAAREASKRTLTEGETANLIRRMADLHESEVQMLRAEIRRREQVENLVRYSKHQAIEALNNAEIRIRNYEVFMRDHDLDYRAKFGTAYEPAKPALLFAEENKQLLAMGTKPAAATPMEVSAT